MKKIFFIFSTMIIAMSYVNAQRNDIVVNYLPVRSDVVGRTISYQDGQALFTDKIPNLRLKEEGSSDRDIQEFKSRLSFGISNILKGNNVRNITIDATNVKITNVDNEVETIPKGSQIVMSGLKADSVSVTITKNADYKLSASDLLEKIKKYAPLSDANTLNAVTLLDSINYEKSKTVKLTIKNPNVYYCIIVGQVRKGFGKNKYLDIPYQLGKECNLSLNGIATSRIRLMSSKEFENLGVQRDFMFKAILNSQNEPELHVLVTKDEGFEDFIVPRTGNTFSTINQTFKSQILGKITKKYLLDLSAQISEDKKSIIITSGEIRYEEWVFSPIKRKDLK